MRILYIPLDYHRHKEDDRFFGDLLRAFQNQCECIIYDGNIDNAIAFKPTHVFYQGSLTIEDIIKIKTATKCKWTTWTGDVRYAPMQYLMDLKEVTDQYYFPFSGELLRTYSRLLGKTCVYIYEPFQDWRYKTPKQMTEGRISFVGNVYETLPGGTERIEISKYIGKHCSELVCYGSGFDWSIKNCDVPDLYNDSYLVIADNNWNDIEGYFTPRNLGAMAAGSCCLMRTFPGIEEHFENWKHCVYYRHKYELLDIITFLKVNPEVRNRIAIKGHELATTKYSMNNFVKQFIAQL